MLIPTSLKHLQFISQKLSTYLQSDIKNSIISCKHYSGFERSNNFSIVFFSILLQTYLNSIVLKVLLKVTEESAHSFWGSLLGSGLGEICLSCPHSRPFLRSFLAILSKKGRGTLKGSIELSGYRRTRNRLQKSGRKPDQY